MFTRRKNVLVAPAPFLRWSLSVDKDGRTERGRIREFTHIVVWARSIDEANSELKNEFGDVVRFGTKMSGNLKELKFYDYLEPMSSCPYPDSFVQEMQYDVGSVELISVLTTSTDSAAISSFRATAREAGRVRSLRVEIGEEARKRTSHAMSGWDFETRGVIAKQIQMLF